MIFGIVFKCIPPFEYLYLVFKKWDAIQQALPFLNTINQYSKGGMILKTSKKIIPYICLYIYYVTCDRVRVRISLLINITFKITYSINLFMLKIIIPVNNEKKTKEIK